MVSLMGDAPGSSYWGPDKRSALRAFCFSVDASLCDAKFACAALTGSDSLKPLPIVACKDAFLI
jgi:hypothetical protein